MTPAQLTLIFPVELHVLLNTKLIIDLVNFEKNTLFTLLLMLENIKVSEPGFDPGTYGLLFICSNSFFIIIKKKNCKR